MFKLLHKSKYPTEMLSFLAERTSIIYVQFIIGSKKLYPFKRTRSRKILNISFQTAFEPRSDKRGLVAIKVKSEIFTEKERSSCCEQLQKI